MKMKKMKRFLISGLLAGCWAACNSNDYKMYSGEAYIQFSETKEYTATLFVLFSAGTGDGRHSLV